MGYSFGRLGVRGVSNWHTNLRHEIKSYERDQKSLIIKHSFKIENDNFTICYISLLLNFMTITIFEVQPRYICNTIWEIEKLLL